MEILGKEVSIDELLEMDDYNPEKNFLKKRKNSLYLSDRDISILKSYEIPYEKCKNMKELLFMIESYNSLDDEDEELDELSKRISEYCYYYKTNK